MRPNADSSFEQLFAPEPDNMAPLETQKAWKVLLVDDEPDVHTALHLTLEDVEVEGRRLDLYDATSACQARSLLTSHPDMALVLLDVVMETERAGLDLVRFVRRELDNRTTQIVVLTGQPGYAPQREVVADFEIDGYRLKSELTSDRVFATVYTVLRTHQAMRELVEQQDAIRNMARRIEEREERLRAVLESAPDAIVLIDSNGTIFDWNARAARLFGYTRREIEGKTFAALLPEHERMAAVSRFEYLLRRASEVPLSENPIEGVARRKDGVLVPVELMLGTWNVGTERNFSAIVRDVSERKRAEEDLRLAASVFANSCEGIIISDAQRIIVDVNPAFSRMTGFSPEEALGKSSRFLSAGLYDADFYHSVMVAVKELDFWQGEMECRRRDGTLFTEVLSISAVRDQNGKVTHYIDVFSDVTLVKEHEKELIRVANYDSLTGLPNRRLLADRMQQAMASCRRAGRPMAVCYLDLDGFKRVNDELGHAMGDRLLVEMTERLKSVLREDDTLARMGGDEFVFLLTNLSDSESCRPALDRVLNEVNVPVLLNGRSVTVSGSIGATVYPLDEADADTLLRHADQAMYVAKEAGKKRYHFFDAEHDREVKSRRLYAEALTAALDQRQFVLHYQPKVDMVDGRVVGVEALIRWQHPERGLLLPKEFLPHLEGDELEVAVGEWVVNEALRQIAAWKQAGLAMPVSVNIGAYHLLRRQFSERLQEMLQEHPDVRPEELELEILETTALTDMKLAVQTLGRCHKMGVRISLDDFGTGYSSLTYFLKLPVQSLKVDQSFVRGMLDDPNKLGIVEGVVRLAHAFNRKAVAEGVETLEHAGMLRALDCRLAQGFGIARPMPAAALPDWVEHWRRTEPWRALTAPDVQGDVLLAVARRSHVRWTEEILQAVEYPERPLEASLDALNCPFGRWYAGSGAARYGNVPAFHELGMQHERAHRIAAELLGMQRGSEASLRMAERLKKTRNQMIALLNALAARSAREGGVELR